MTKHVVDWTGRRGFAGTTPDGRKATYDLPIDAGGDGAGPTPMEAVLHALAACSAVDVVAIMEKMRLPLEALRVEVSAERAETHPRVFTEIHMDFIATGDLPARKLERAVELSANKYCSVGAMLGRTARITHTVIIET